MGWRDLLGPRPAAPIAHALDDEIGRLELLVLYGWQGVALVTFLMGVSAFVLVPNFGPASFLAPVALGLWFAWVARVTRLGQRRRLREWGNPLVESAVPTVAVVVLTRTQGAPYALGSWVPPILIGCVMSVGILRLRPTPPLVVGVLGAIEYELSYALYVRDHLTPAALAEPLLGPRMQIVRGTTFLVAGALASLLAMGLERAIGKAATKARARDLFGKYRLEHPIASGGMATVYAATYCPEGGFERPVAIKRIHPHLAALPAFVDGFRNEAELGARLVHPNIVQVFDFGRVEETYFLAMEFVDGVTLSALMKSLRAGREPMPPGLVAFLGHELLEGLAYSHAGARDAEGGLLRVVHRDVSPSNVLLSRNGEVKLSDFGLARALRGASAYMTRSIAGHLSYMAPEQASGKETDERSDLFAIGVILWELLAGCSLFRREHDGATLLAILSEPAPPPSSRRDDIDGPAWDALLERALRREPLERFQTAREMAAALAGIFAKTSPTGSRGLSDLVTRVAEEVRVRAVRDELPTVPAAEFVVTTPGAAGAGVEDATSKRG